MSYEEEDTCIPLVGLSHQVKFKKDEIKEENTCHMRRRICTYIHTYIHTYIQVRELGVMGRAQRALFCPRIYTLDRQIYIYICIYI